MRVFLSLVMAFGWGISLSNAQEFPNFKMQEIAKDLAVGYAVIAVDINGDQKPDLVVVDAKRIIWYENPTWQVHTIITGKTKPDNVCVAAHDIDGDGQVDLVIGADWKPFNTKEGGTLQWLKRGKTLDDEWSVHPIAEEPTVHRVRMADIDGDGKPEIILAPLMGRDSSKEKNWVDGRPVRILAFPIPKDPVKGPWTPVVLSESLNVVHNIWPVKSQAGKTEIYAVSYDGVHLISQDAQSKWQTIKLGVGNQEKPAGNRGASEIKLGHLKEVPFIATIEPWHGNQVVTYTRPKAESDGLWNRHVIDTQLNWGHAVSTADLDGDGIEELIIGVRDNPPDRNLFKEMRGVRIYKATDGTGSRWKRLIVDDGGIATEDLIAVDLNSDGRTDIVAVGRATHNARIYWNTK